MLHRPGVLFPRTWIATSNLKRDVSIKINEIDFKIWLRMQSLLCYLQSWKLYPPLAASKWPTLYPIIQNILLAHIFIHLECFFNITSNWTNISMPPISVYANTRILARHLGHIYLNFSSTYIEAIESSNLLDHLWIHRNIVEQPDTVAVGFLLYFTICSIHVVTMQR